MIHVLLHNIRSIHNVGSILRSCDGFGATSVVYSGYTPFPIVSNDTRLPHIANKITRAMHKTALGAEKTIEHIIANDVLACVQEYSHNGWTIVGLEQDSSSVPISEYTNANDPILLVLGEEVEGIQGDLLRMCDVLLEIPMVGQKESFNVSVAAGICLYHLYGITAKL